MFSLPTSATRGCGYGASFATLEGGVHTIDKNAGWTKSLNKECIQNFMLMGEVMQANEG